MLSNRLSAGASASARSCSAIARSISASPWNGFVSTSYALTSTGSGLGDVRGNAGINPAGICNFCFKCSVIIAIADWVEHVVRFHRVDIIESFGDSFLQRFHGHVGVVFRLSLGLGSRPVSVLRRYRNAGSDLSRNVVDHDRVVGPEGLSPA